MKKILFILQIILKIFIIFFLVFIWTRYFIRSLWICLLISAVTSGLIYLFLHFLSNKKNSASNLKIKEKEEAENIFLSLATKGENLNFFYTLAKTRYPSVEKKSKYILINNSEKIKSIIFPCLKFSQLTNDDIVQITSIVKKENPSKVIIVCGEISPDTINFANNFDMQILLLDKYSSYKALYKEFDFFPEISFEYKKDKARTFKEIIKFAFSKDKAKGYLLSAFVLLLSSFFVRINLYYCIVSSILLVFALICYSTKSDEMPNEVL